MDRRYWCVVPVGCDRSASWPGVMDLGHSAYKLLTGGGSAARAGEAVVKFIRGWCPWLATIVNPPFVLGSCLVATISAFPRKAADASCW